MTLAELQQRAGNGEPFDYLFFWGHQPDKEGRITSSCLSQWYVAPFTLEGIDYATAEHFMMAEKARLFDDQEVLKEILESSTPAQAKKLGRKVRNFNEQLWNDRRFEIVVRGNRAKFSQNEPPATFLKGTEEKILVEASLFDRIWGIGMGRNNPQAGNPLQWKGLNLLGFALMEVRNGL